MMKMIANRQLENGASILILPLMALTDIAQVPVRHAAQLKLGTVIQKTSVKQPAETGAKARALVMAGAQLASVPLLLATRIRPGIVMTSQVVLPLEQIGAKIHIQILIILLRQLCLHILDGAQAINAQAQSVKKILLGIVIQKTNVLRQARNGAELIALVPARSVAQASLGTAMIKMNAPLPMDSGAALIALVPVRHVAPLKNGTVIQKKIARNPQENGARVVMGMVGVQIPVRHVAPLNYGTAMMRKIARMQKGTGAALIALVMNVLNATRQGLGTATQNLIARFQAGTGAAHGVQAMNAHLSAAIMSASQERAQLIAKRTALTM